MVEAIIFVPLVVLPMANISASVSTVSTCESTYALILCWVASLVALLLDILSSSRIAVPETDVLMTGEVKVLLVSVCACVSLATVESTVKVKLVLLIVLSIPLPPIKPRVCESRSMDRLLPSPSVRSKSAAVATAST